MYQTDSTETEWQYITKVLNLQEIMRKYDLRMIWNAMFYLVKLLVSGECSPKNFQNGICFYYYYRKWTSLDEFDLLLERLRGSVRVLREQNKEPNAWNHDSQSVKRENVP